MSQVGIDVVDLHFSFHKKKVLQGVSWRIGSGVTALLGPNGCGKTTLIKCLTGLSRPSKGDIQIAGQHIGTLSAAQQRLGYVPQNPILPSIAKVYDIVSYAAWLSAVPKNEVDQNVKMALQAMDIADIAKRRVGSLSGGQYQRVALATGIVHDPALIILDEPTVGLDPGQRLKVREVIRRIGENRPVLLSTHMTEDVEHLAQHVGILARGKIQFSGPIGELARAIKVRTDDNRPGSPFERGYDDLMMGLGDE